MWIKIAWSSYPKKGYNNRKKMKRGESRQCESILMMFSLCFHVYLCKYSGTHWISLSYDYASLLNINPFVSLESTIADWRLEHDKGTFSTCSQQIPFEFICSLTLATGLTIYPVRNCIIFRIWWESTAGNRINRPNNGTKIENDIQIIFIYA